MYYKRLREVARTKDYKYMEIFRIATESFRKDETLDHRDVLDMQQKILSDMEELRKQRILPKVFKEILE